ncbi:HD-GYP domain-containing protein [Clostridium chromiireducens]|uniref:Cyclic di-GMP phosphodiesterase response regulator RpfG n=1 Tax=Clostridium chromiireducens TaxID=225345 RepID=A0A1V4IYV9_9CLOT|nr:HD-GYP domain-containing protein [Clostridium chromiireducens]OPJ64965.1 cyclic di-GMP phosphodiesterase response regulator RpfG [Clostridium chromiireducens]RII32024.1 HD-GYP domain-containing protein [Clostridium chromiireducens]
MRLVPIECVKPNSIIGKTLYDSDGRVLVREGVTLSEGVISKIKNINILSIYIIDEYSSEEIEDIIKPELRQKAIITIKEAFSNINRLTVADKFSKKETVYFENIENMAENLIENILSNRNILLSLVDIRSMDNYIYSHSVNVAVISLIIGITLKLPKKQLQHLCIGALLHDVGKSFIPKEILMKEEELTPEETLILKQHSTLGYKYLSDSYNLSAHSKVIALQHHERCDGLGYPNGLTNGEINILSKIVSIANAYDELSSGRPNKKAMFPSDVLEYLMSNAGKIFDYDIVITFCKIVIPFSKGTLVELSTGDIAVVQETLPNFPLRPIVKILRSTDSNMINKEVNLIDEISTVITSIKYEL